MLLVWLVSQLDKASDQKKRPVEVVPAHFPAVAIVLYMLTCAVRITTPQMFLSKGPAVGRFTMQQPACPCTRLPCRLEASVDQQGDAGVPRGCWQAWHPIHVV